MERRQQQRTAEDPEVTAFCNCGFHLGLPPI